MAADMMKIALIFTGINRMGGVLTSINTGLDKVSKKIEKINKISGRMMAAGAGIAGGTLAVVAMTAKKFMGFEEAQIILENTLRRSNGTVDPYFWKISAVAAKLGAQLPGTTQDFFQLASSMLQAGSGAQSLADGGLQAAAYMAAVLKLDYVEAGESISKFQQALGIADNDLIRFADTVQRTAHLGVKIEEMRYAFSKMAGPLKVLGIQGIDSANKLAPLVGMLIRTGRAGEEVGTSLGNIFSTGLTKGLFHDTEGLLRYMDAIGKLDKRVQMQRLEKVFGKGGATDIAAIIATNGIAGYQKMTVEMTKQASLEQRKAASLKGLSAMYEAMTGTIENVAVAIGSVFGPELKSGAEKVNDFAGKIEGWVRANKVLVASVFKGVVVFGGFLLTMGAVGKVIYWTKTAVQTSLVVWNGLQTAVMVLPKALTAAKIALTAAKIAFTGFRNAISLARVVMALFGVTSKIAIASTGIGLLIVAAVLIYEHWDKIKSFFIALWPSVKPYIQPLLDFFTKLWQTISNVASGMGRMLGIGGKMPASMPVRSLPPGTTGRGVGSTVVNYSPTINGAVGTKADMRALLDSHAKQISGIVQQQNQRQARRAY